MVFTCVVESYPAFKFSRTVLLGCALLLFMVEIHNHPSRITSTFHAHSQKL